VDLALTSGGTVRGRVLTSDGRAVAWATVGLTDRHRRMDGEATALADVAGRYAVPGLRPAEYDVRVVAPGHALLADASAPGGAVRVTVPPDRAEVVRDLVLVRGGAAHGVLRTPDGVALPGARLEVTAGADPVRAAVRDLATVSAPDGSWRLVGIPPDAEVQVVARHDEWARSPSAPFRVPAGTDREVPIPLREGARLPGLVEEGPGRPVEGARVRWAVVPPGQEGRFADAFRADEHLSTRVLRSDADGRFAIDRLEGGRLAVKVEREGYAAWYRNDVVVGGEGLQPTLAVGLVGGRRIRGRVLDARTGAGVAEAWVYAKEQSSLDGAAPEPGRVLALLSAQTGADGSFTIEPLPPARYEVVAWLAFGYVAHAQEPRNPALKRDAVEAGAEGLEFRLEPEPPPVLPPR
jgi:hypothetical protein